MLCSDLKVVSLNITEDNYEYSAMFRLCTEGACMDLKLEQVSEKDVLEEVKKTFDIQESPEEMKEIIMSKIMEASKLESRVSEGEKLNDEIKDKKLQRDIDSLSIS